MPNAPALHLQKCRRRQAALLERLADGAVLVGTIGALARTEGVTTTELRCMLRGLLEARRIVVHAEPNGEYSIRRERRTSGAGLPPMERRRRMADLWIL
jgi:hypothetical protein